MPRGYFSAPLSENISETPEGFLICKDTVLGRTGFQTYQIRELPKEAADRLGIDVSNPSANIELYRSADEVFAPDALASLNGKPVTDGHPNSDDGFVNPDNFNEFARGHVQNPRRGDEPLDDGEWPIIGDVLITAEPLLSKVKNRTARELSLGYDYALERAGDRVEQRDFQYNHLAVVPKGRAGPEARIQDSAPTESPPAAPAPQGEKATTSTTTKEKRPVKNPFHALLGRGLRAMAADAETDPEELAQAAMEIGKHQEPPAQSGDKHADDRKRARDAFDRLMDGKATDADMNEVKKWIGEEEKEPEHKEADGALDTSELEAAMGARDTSEESCPSCHKPMADCMCTDAADEEEDGGEGPGEETEPDGEEEVVGEDRRVRAADTVSGAKAVLKALRPVVARSQDKAVQSAFNSALAAVTRGSRVSAGGYDSFARTARTADGKARRAETAGRARARAADAANDPVKKLQAAYDAARQGGK